MQKKTAQGFTLVELLVVISIIIILATVVMIVINPFETLKRGRDSTRLSDLVNLQQAINVAVQESASTSAQILCKGTTAPCRGASNDASSRANSGSGWVKVDLSSQQTVSVPTLPIDPSDGATYHYVYCSDGNAWKIESKLESTKELARLTGDGGIDTTLYEVGSNLSIVCAY